MNQKNNQKKMEQNNNMLYAMYMMLGSSFRKASCPRRNLENKLATAYRRLKEADQVALEDTCIGFAENVLEKELPESIFAEEVTVLLKSDEEELGTAFVGENFYLCVYAMKDGARYYLNYDFFQGGELAKSHPLPDWLIMKLAERKKREEQRRMKAEKNLASAEGAAKENAASSKKGPAGKTQAKGKHVA